MAICIELLRTLIVLITSVMLAGAFYKNPTEIIINTGKLTISLISCTVMKKK